MTHHPAVFSPTILERLRALAPAWDGPILDPYAGTGLVHQLGRADTFGVELEPEWADMHERTFVGDATALPFANSTIGTVVTSPPYGNRLADNYRGNAEREKCRKCDGTGMDTHPHPHVCTKCEGTGKAKSSSAMKHNRKHDPDRECAVCGAPMERKRFNGRLEDRTRFLSRKTCGQSCGNTRDEITRDGHQYRARRFLKDDCESCGSTDRLHVHHVDRDWTNNVEENLMTLCAPCHMALHWREDWAGLPKPIPLGASAR